MKINRRQWVVLLAGVAAVGSVWAQQAGPFRTMSVPGAERLMLEGYDAVGYFTQDTALKGDPAFQLDHAGVQWRFASAANMAEFQRDPVRYMPQFGGFCSNGINYAVPGGGGGGANTWRIYRGRLYVFGGQSSRDQFEMDTERNLQRAHTYWDAEVAGSGRGAAGTVGGKTCSRQLAGDAWCAAGGSRAALNRWRPGATTPQAARSARIQWLCRRRSAEACASVAWYPASIARWRNSVDRLTQ